MEMVFMYGNFPYVSHKEIGPWSRCSPQLFEPYATHHPGMVFLCSLSLLKEVFMSLQLFSKIKKSVSCLQSVPATCCDGNM